MRHFAAFVVAAIGPGHGVARLQGVVRPAAVAAALGMLALREWGHGLASLLHKSACSAGRRRGLYHFASINKKKPPTIEIACKVAQLAILLENVYNVASLRLIQAVGRLHGSKSRVVF